MKERVLNNCMITLYLFIYQNTLTTDIFIS